ncbi:MAG: hypothetical protein A2W36_02370 [Chloroflexi bacterium RBG_16_58_14]|nr:MAG: hypothetical protein A2W36_02370 [Chloroflexi bacterium RBG_16_58_14]
MDNLDQKIPDNKRSENAWAPPTQRMTVSGAPAEAMNLNVEGRQPTSPLQGFGQMWQKTFKIRLIGVEMTPVQVMQIWKENFPKFQPPENRFYPTMSEITPGEVLLIEGKVPPLPGLPSVLPVATGVMVLYADDEMFTVMCPEGHPLSGWNTFSAFEEDGTVVAQVQEQSRASDPLYEFFNRYLGASAQQDKIWTHVLSSLAAHLGVDGDVEMQKVLIDPKVQWSAAKNIWHNAAIRTVLYMPVILKRSLSRR